MTQILEKVWELITIYGLKVLAAIVILVVGRWIAKLITNIIRKMMQKGDVDSTVLKFVGNMA
jgi:small conductance mechanosensitive channel